MSDRIRTVSNPQNDPDTGDIYSVFNAAGNMTTVPKPSDLTAGYTCTYDAWNRLVKVVDGSNTITEYQYDGVKRRNIKKIYVSGVLDETRHLFYTEPDMWQVIEERVDADTDPNCQFVWGLRYQDDLILRDRDTTGNGTLDERLYGLQDANWNLTSIAGTDGAMLERYAYDGYGTSIVLTPAFVVRTSSSYDWETRFASYRFDIAISFYHVRNRVLVPNLGWLQRDPLGMSAGINLYEYAFGNPIAITDPSGMFSLCPLLLSRELNCLCFIIEVLDLFGPALQALLLLLGIPPVAVTILLNFLDCICDILSILATTFCLPHCEGSLFSLTGAIFSCAWNIATSLNPLIGSQALGDLGGSMWSHLGGEINPGTISGAAACIEVFGIKNDMAKDPFGRVRE